MVFLVVAVVIAMCKAFPSCLVSGNYTAGVSPATPHYQGLDAGLTCITGITGDMSLVAYTSCFRRVRQLIVYQLSGGTT